jgi:hypothetical protein
MLTFTYPEKTVIEISKAFTGERITLSRQIKGDDIVYEVNGGSGEDMKRIAYEMEQAFIEAIRSPRAKTPINA